MRSARVVQASSLGCQSFVAHASPPTAPHWHLLLFRPPWYIGAFASAAARGLGHTPIAKCTPPEVPRTTGAEPQIWLPLNELYPRPGHPAGRRRKRRAPRPPSIPTGHRRGARQRRGIGSPSQHFANERRQPQHSPCNGVGEQGKCGERRDAHFRPRLLARSCHRPPRTRPHAPLVVGDAVRSSAGAPIDLSLKDPQPFHALRTPTKSARAPAAPRRRGPTKGPTASR